ncbi:hypothetical protein PPH41_04980, partial [Burkholderia gladioli]|nr:hypothetical protein [Burkholderia gladioli]
MTAPAHTRHADERGQALLPALLFLAVGCAALLLAFGSLQLTSAKIQLQNTADASAYAAALLQARDYNFSAYTNRAMIANQAAVAQMVGLKSFIDMLDEHVAENSSADRVASQVSRNGVDEWIRKKREARALIHPVRERLDVDLPRMTRSLDTIISALSDAQRSYHEATLMGVPSLAGQVAIRLQPAVDVHRDARPGPILRPHRRHDRPRRGARIAIIHVAAVAVPALVAAFPAVARAAAAFLARIVDAGLDLPHFPALPMSLRAPVARCSSLAAVVVPVLDPHLDHLGRGAVMPRLHPGRRAVDGLPALAAGPQLRAADQVRFPADRPPAPVPDHRFVFLDPAPRRETAERGSRGHGFGKAVRRPLKRLEFHGMVTPGRQFLLRSRVVECAVGKPRIGLVRARDLAGQA